jgi:NADH:ubiquinone oxidoreductase subunit E
MNPHVPNPGATPGQPPENWKTDEAALLTMLEEIERKHGYIPHQIGDEVSRLLEVKLERLKRAQSKLETGVRRDVQVHVARWRGEEGNLIMILHAIQNQYGYVPREVAMELARELGVKLARIYEVITFYHYFKLQPPGKHNVTVCNGTACYLKGAGGLINELRSQLGVSEGETTPDREFHVDVVRCIGCCGMAPAVVCDGKTHGRVKPTDIAGLLADIRSQSKEVKS